MAVEPRRGCGYRKVGGLYLTGSGSGHPCCKLPIPLTVCPTCGTGVKQTRGWTWIDPRPWVKGECKWRGTFTCPAESPEIFGEQVGLLWVGTAFYPTPKSFMDEADKLGVSRRIRAIPRGFVLGEDWVFFAHPKVIPIAPGPSMLFELGPAIFRIFRPTSIEKIVTETMSKDADEMKKLADKGITPVIVPDNDMDHQGSVYDKEDEELNGLETV